MSLANTTTSTESLAEVVTKASPPVGVSLATVAGLHIHDLVLWATLIYTVLMIGHKIYRIYRDVTKNDGHSD